MVAKSEFLIYSKGYRLDMNNINEVFKRFEETHFFNVFTATWELGSEDQ